jgi:class 3 adenylate cyclase
VDPVVKRFDEPDEVVSTPLLDGEIVRLGEVHVGRFVHHAGWRWSEHMKPVVGTTHCEHHHQGFVITGEFEFTMADGARRRVRAGEVYDIPPGHDGRVVGDEDAVAIEFAGVRGWGRPPAGERILATLVVTDIVDSTTTAAELGDTRWTELLGRHSDRVRVELDGLTIRVGVHTGEIERDGSTVRGVSVHAATRVASSAGAGEVHVSSATAALLEGSGLELEDAGEHVLKGLPGPRRLYRLARSG